VGVIRSKKLIALIIFSWWVSFEVKKIHRFDNLQLVGVIRSKKDSTHCFLARNFV